MDLVVVDSSVAVKWFVVEPHSTESRQLLGEYLNGAIDLLAPDLIYSEIGNIAWKKHLFQGMALADAEQIPIAFANIGVKITSAVDLVQEAFLLAVKHQRSFYDMLYLALSVHHNCRWVTADDKLVNALAAQFPKIVSVSRI